MVDPNILNHDTINALNETLKILIGAGGAAVGGLGAWITILSNKTSKAAKSNEDVTTANTAALAEHSAKMTQNLNQMELIKKDGVREIREVSAALTAELNQMKIAVAKVHLGTESKLSQIPRVQDAIADLDKRTLDTAFKAASTESKVEEILSIVNQAKRGRRS